MDSHKAEKNVFFYMAYLVQAADGLADGVPADREGYEVISSKRMGGTAHDLRFTYKLTSDIILPITVPFFVDAEPSDLARDAGEVAQQLNQLESDKHEIVDWIDELEDHARKKFKSWKRTIKSLRFVSLTLDFREYIYAREPVGFMCYEIVGPEGAFETKSVQVSKISDIDAVIGSLRS